MRAGDYALYQGREYRCSPPLEPQIRLFLDGDHPRPDGLERDRREWSRPVDRSDIARLTVVTTVAVWQGREVRVTLVSDDAAQAVVESRTWPPPEAPAVQVMENLLWRARVPPSELTEVVENTTDIPI
jgi:hypothetical protein